MNTRNLKPYQVTSEDLALARARREKKLKQALEADALQTLSKPNDTLLSRPWITISQPQTSTNSEARSNNVRILTWNLLAQCLVRRELFPTSDCLKIAQRLPLIHEEIRRQDAQIICLQEVDHLEKLLPMLEKTGYVHHYASGPLKKHGCLIAYKKNLYSFISDNTTYYDDQPVGTVGGPGRIGASFRTKNIGYMVALKSKTNETEGIIVATTHLFWHPRYTYERIRQTAILLRETAAFRELHSAKKWPCIIAGDFNFGPSDPAYSLITGDTLLSIQKDLIPPSMVVHSSLDPSILKDTPSLSKTGEEDEGETVDPDRYIINARAPVETDGLLSMQEIITWFSALPKVRSIYADGLREARKLDNDIPSYGRSMMMLNGRNGAEEPEYTSYTHYWQAVLDYIFVIEPSEGSIHINGLLKPLTEKDMLPGLPQKHVSGSDHTCLVAELAW